MEEHDWHPLDVEAGTEVRRLKSGAYEVRSKSGSLVVLTPDEFDAYRQEGPNPKGLT